MPSMKICFLVIIYDKDVVESTTIKSLLSITEEDFSCCIVNNGPYSINPPNTQDFKNIDFRFLEYLENKSLSVIYNEFISHYSDADRFVILDDDSILAPSFKDVVFSDSKDDFDLELPRILDSNNNVHYPLKNWLPITEEVILDYKKDVIFSIGSGLVISRNLVNKFKNKNIKLFNESFVFYGVDFSFFWNLNKNDFGDIKIFSRSEIVHDMSLHGEISEFKRSELYINFSLQARHYPSKVNVKNFLYSLIQTIKKRNLSLLFKMVKSYFIGKHPRS